MMTTVADHIIRKFARRSRERGIRPLARALQYPHSTVAKWLELGHIPARHQQKVLSAARAAGIDLTPADFFPHSNPPHSDPDHTAAEMARGEAA